MTRELLTSDRYGDFNTLELHPTLHQFQLDDLWRQSPALRSQRRWSNENSRGDYDRPLTVIYRRRADFDDSKENLERLRAVRSKSTWEIAPWGVPLSYATSLPKQTDEKEAPSP